MAPLTPSDVKRWDPDAIHQVFQTASNRAQTLQRLGDSLQQVHNGLSDWQGEAGEAFRADLGQTRRDIEADGQESRQVAAAVSVAEADVRACRSELDNIQHAVDANHWAITPDWRIDVGNTLRGPNSGLLAIEQQTLQSALDAVKVHAHNTDHELATAVRSAVGQASAGAGAPAPGATQPQGQPKPQPGEPPKSLQDMLLPAGPANGGDAAKGPPVPAGAGGGRPPSLEDMLLGKGEPAHEPPPPGSLPDLLSRMPRPGALGGAPAPQLKPADIESFKAMARQSMIADGVPPDQIEGRLNDIVGRTQQWMDNGMPNYVPPEPPKPPPPGFGDGFADRWFGFEQSVHDLTGQEGLGKMGDAWGGMAKGFAGRAEDLLLQGPVAPINDLTHEFKSFSDNPSYYLGGKGAEGAIALPGMLFGPEGAGLGEASAAARAGELGDLDAAAGGTHDLPGVHPSLSPLEQAPHEPPLPGGGHEPSGPLEALSGGGHPSGPLEPPLGGGHPAPEPFEHPEVTGHGSDSPSPPMGPGDPLSDQGKLPTEAATSPAQAAIGGGHPPPDPLRVPPVAGHMPSPAEAPAGGGGHPTPGPPGPPMPGGHPPSGPPEPPMSAGHSSWWPSDHPLPGAVDHTPSHLPTDSQWAPVGHDQPVTYHGDAPQAALDLNEAFQQHHPTTELSQRVADMSTHYIGDHPDRVVLGKWAGDDKGYIGEARGHGGIYYDTSTEVWNNVGRGLEKPAANDLGWEVNENFLRTQMERGVGRIDYVLNDSGFSSIEELVRIDPNSFSAREIKFLTENADAYGYERIENSWVRVRGGHQ